LFSTVNTAVLFTTVNTAVLFTTVKNASQALERLSLTGFIRSDKDKLAREKYSSGLYYKHVMIVNDDSSIINK
jgi:hypothetical protein